MRSEITIKPTDKNLGIVILNTDDYINQCLKILSDPNAYRQAKRYPHEQIQEKLTNLLINFKSDLCHVNEELYAYLQPNSNFQTPQFYRLPKVHSFNIYPHYDRMYHTVTPSLIQQPNC